MPPIAPVDLATPDLPEPDRVAILCARPEGGKTSVSRYRLAKWRRVFVFDQQVRDLRGEYMGRVIYSLEELAPALEELAEGLPRRLVYRGPLVDSGPRDPINVAIFEALAELEDLLVVVEEADRVMESKWSPPGLYSIAHHGRRFGQALTLCSRRPANLSRDITATADSFYAWNLGEPADREYLRQRGYPLEVVDSLGKHESIRRFYDADGRPTFYKCSCPYAHSGPCGEPIKVIKAGEGEETDGRIDA